MPTNPCGQFMVDSPAISTRSRCGSGKRTSEVRLLWPTPAREVQTQLIPGEVHAWAFALEPGSATIRSCLAILGPEEKSRALRFHFEHDRVQYVVAHGVLRRLLARYLGTEPAALTFSTTSHGKPCLEGLQARAGIQFNLSHSAGLGVAVFSQEGPVGVDVEALRPLSDASALVARFFSRRERELFESLSESEKTAAFYRLWTRKEAWLKATGEGISELLHLVEVSFCSDEEAHFLALPPWAQSLGSWNLYPLNPAAGFTGALAASVRAERVLCQSWRHADEGCRSR